MAASDIPPIWIRGPYGVAFGDIPVRGGGRMPDFCVIGAAKAGTTALDKRLSRHPDIYTCPQKEPHYFSTRVMLDKGDDWYRGLYRDAKPDQLCGEASTSYARYPLVAGTAERMAAANPDMKLLYILREPVARVESECLQLVKYLRNVMGEDHSGLTLDAFFHLVEDPDHPYYQAIVASSRYADQLDAFEAVFARDRILVLMQDDLRTDPDALLARVCAFLGVDPSSMPSGISSDNVSADFLRGIERTRITSRLRRLPFYDALKTMLPERLKARILSIPSRGAIERQHAFGEETKRRLHQGFIEPNRRLAARIGELPADWST